LVETVPAGDALTNADMLDSAIEQLKMKIEDPSRHEEAEALYQGGDDMLINAFSADALNENPDWGQDLDDEADVAAHQLELARSYLEMGMKETAIELLERVVVSPDRACANQARVMLDAHRA
jgi:FimV-like protein